MVDGAAQEPGLDREPDTDVFALHDNGLCLVQQRRFATWLGGEQLLRIGVLGALENLFDRTRLDDLTLGHDEDAISKLADDAEIMGDEQHRHAMLGLQATKKIEDLGLNRDVERGRRLVGNQELGTVGKRHGDHHALPLAAG